MTALPRSRSRTWQEVVGNAAIDLAVRHVAAAREGDPHAVPHPARLVDLVLMDARRALGPEPSASFRTTIDGEELVTSPGMMRAVIAHHAPEGTPAAAILAVVMDAMESRLGSLLDRARALGIPDHATLTASR